MAEISYYRTERFGLRTRTVFEVFFVVSALSLTQKKYRPPLRRAVVVRPVLRFIKGAAASSGRRSLKGIIIA
jgi:hypothetical protein